MVAIRTFRIHTPAHTHTHHHTHTHTHPHIHTPETRTDSLSARQVLDETVHSTIGLSALQVHDQPEPEDSGVQRTVSPSARQVLDVTVHSTVGLSAPQVHDQSKPEDSEVKLKAKKTRRGTKGGAKRPAVAG